jgi:hypothetical protein
LVTGAPVVAPPLEPSERLGGQPARTTVAMIRKTRIRDVYTVGGELAGVVLPFPRTPPPAANPS